jgi:hypothetical protein
MSRTELREFSRREFTHAPYFPEVWENMAAPTVGNGGGVGIGGAGSHGRRWGRDRRHRRRSGKEVE